MNKNKLVVFLVACFILLSVFCYLFSAQFNSLLDTAEAQQKTISEQNELILEQDRIIRELMSKLEQEQEQQDILPQGSSIIVKRIR